VTTGSVVHAPAPVSQFVTVNGLKLHYLDWAGPPGAAAVPLLMVHGLSTQAHSWDPIAASLCSERRVIAIDLRGHGDSQWAADGYFLPQFVSDLTGFAAALGISSLDYVGQSFGAQVGLALAGASPGLVRRMIVNDMGPEMAKAAVGGTRAVVSGDGVKGFSTREQVRAHYTGQYPEWQPAFVDAFAQYQVRQNWAGKLVFKSDPELFWLLGSAGKRDLGWVWEMTERITGKTLVLWCTRSTVLDQDIVSRMEQRIPNTAVRRVDGTHFYPRENPEAFTAIVRDFLHI
jgi:pimeloyl-ACP methyl ester carboxylesterase